MPESKQVIADMIRVVWQEGDLDALGRYWTEDCINHADDDAEGLPALRDYHVRFASSFEGFRDITITLVHQVAENDLVVTHLVTTGHHEATGRAVRLRTMRIDRVRAARIAEHWSVVDLAGLAAQLS